MFHESIGHYQRHKQDPIPPFAPNKLVNKVPQYTLPEDEMTPQQAYHLIHNEILQNTDPRFNLATFLNTWVEPEAEVLLKETQVFNQAEKEEHSLLEEIELRCLNILARLWHAPGEENGTGCSTPGSNEACFLGGLALKWQWRKQRLALGKATDQPNVVMSISAQASWEKFCRYFDVEGRFVPMEDERLYLTGEEAVKYCDENTIGVIAMLGSPLDGSYEPVQKISQALDQLYQERGLDIPIHVDASSGGLVAPFLQPDIVWDFRLSRVKSIQSSGYKYGLSYPGLSWILWREKRILPENLFDPLGHRTSALSFSFSRPSNQIFVQYYNFLRLGKRGYQRVHQSAQEVALYLIEHLGSMGPFRILTEICNLPVFIFTLKDSASFSLFELSARLREQGWFIPAYILPVQHEDLVVMRIVVREGLNFDLAEYLLKDIRQHLDQLMVQRHTGQLVEHRQEQIEAPIIHHESIS